jgi:hypothetical protein
MDICSHVFRGKRFKVIFKAPKNRNHIGICDYEAKEIKINPKIDEAEILDCIIHEALHACLPDISDDAIDESATSVAKLLWKLGYRGDKK